jgi:hypothetical protein
MPKNVIKRHIKTTSTCEKKDANIQKNIIAKKKDTKEKKIIKTIIKKTKQE